VAFATIYRSTLPADMSLDEFRELSPRAEELWDQRLCVSVSVSVFVSVSVSSVSTD